MTRFTFIGSKVIFLLYQKVSITFSDFKIKPHFLDADKSLLEKVDGLRPNRSKHDVFVNFEPVIFSRFSSLFVN